MPEPTTFARNLKWLCEFQGWQRTPLAEEVADRLGKAGQDINPKTLETKIARWTAKGLRQVDGKSQSQIDALLEVLDCQHLIDNYATLWHEKPEWIVWLRLQHKIHATTSHIMRLAPQLFSEKEVENCVRGGLTPRQTLARLAAANLGPQEVKQRILADPALKDDYSDVSDEELNDFADFAQKNGIDKLLQDLRIEDDVPSPQDLKPQPTPTELEESVRKAVEELTPTHVDVKPLAPPIVPIGVLPYDAFVKRWPCLKPLATELSELVDLHGADEDAMFRRLIKLKDSQTVEMEMRGEIGALQNL